MKGMAFGWYTFMKKIPFTIDYYGHKTNCIAEGNHFRVQITYTPVHLLLQKDEQGQELWIEEGIKQETPLSKELGRMIREQYLD